MYFFLPHLAFRNVSFSILSIRNPIDYRTQAKPGSNPVVAGTADRALTELVRSGIGSGEVVRRHRPIIPIW